MAKYLTGGQGNHGILWLVGLLLVAWLAGVVRFAETV